MEITKELIEQTKKDIIVSVEDGRMRINSQRLLFKLLTEAMNYIPCCKSDSELLRGKWDITFEQWIELYYEEYSPTQVISKEGVISYKTDLEKMFYKLRNP